MGNLNNRSPLIISHRQEELWEDKGEGSVDFNINRTFAALRRFVNDEINETIFAIRLAEIVLASGIESDY